MNEKNVELYKDYYYDPVKWVEVFIGVKLEREQKEIMESIVKNNRVAVRSGHGIGKTATLALLCLWFMSTRAFCKIPMTAPSQHQLRDILMPEINKWIYIGKLEHIIAFRKTKIFMTGYEERWFATALSCRIPENMQGFHAEDLLFIVDEASGIPKEIIEVIEGALTTGGAKLILLGNPTKLSGAFFDAFHSERGMYYTLHYSSENSKLVNKKFISKMKKYGVESDIYRVRVLGEFPTGEPDTFITLDLVEDSVNREISDDWDIVSIGVDPARFGNDESVICWRRGMTVQNIIRFAGIDTVRLSGEIINLAKKIYKNYKKEIKIKVDDTGVGGGVTDQLSEINKNELRKPAEKMEFKIDIIPVINNGKSTDSNYANYGTQIWGEMKEALKTMKIPNDNDLIAQLSTRKYGLKADGKIILESKDDMKKRGLPSPDRADALSLCLCNKIGFDFGSIKLEYDIRGQNEL